MWVSYSKFSVYSAHMSPTNPALISVRGPVATAHCGWSCHRHHEQQQQQQQRSAAINSVVHHISVAVWSAWSVDLAGRCPWVIVVPLEGVRRESRCTSPSDICVSQGRSAAAHSNLWTRRPQKIQSGCSMSRVGISLTSLHADTAVCCSHSIPCPGSINTDGRAYRWAAATSRLPFCP